MTKNAALFFFSLVFALNLQAQSKDFGIWSQLTLEKKLTPRTSISISESIRTNDNSSRINAHFTHLNFDFQPTKKINLALGYRNAQKFNFDETTDFRQRFQFEIVYKLKFKNLSISLQERFQSQFENINRSANGLIPEFYFRTRATFTYNLDKKITPFFSSEVFLNQDKFVDNLRFRLGCDYDFNKKNGIKLFYMMDLDVQQKDPQNLYAIGLAYKFAF